MRVAVGRVAAVIVLLDFARPESCYQNADLDSDCFASGLNHLLNQVVGDPVSRAGSEAPVPGMGYCAHREIHEEKSQENALGAPRGSRD